MREMSSRLERLIEELCWDRVKYLTLREVVQISVGGDLPISYAKGQREPTGQYPYPIYSNGIGNAALYGFTDDYKIEKEAVTISARGTIGYHTIRAGNQAEKKARMLELLRRFFDRFYGI